MRDDRLPAQRRGDLAGQADDVTAAIAFLRARAGAYGIDATRLATWGDSAGGQLALTAAFTVPDIAACVAWYPVTDVAALYAEVGESFSPLLGGWPSDLPTRVADASPITRATQGAPPCLLIHGERDTLVPPAQSLRLHGRLRDLGVAAECRIVPGAEHGFEGYPDVAELVRDSVEFLAGRLRERRPAR